MRVYYFWCYWSSNLLFFVRCVTYISNVMKIGQKLRLLSRAIGTSDRQTDRRTDRQALKCFNAQTIMINYFGL